MVYNLKQLRLKPQASFFKADNGAHLFEVTVDRYYQGHDLSTAFCYLKVRFKDGTTDKFLLGSDFDEDTVTVATNVTARMQRVEGVAKYQLSFEHTDFKVQSDVFDITILNAIGDAVEEDPDVPAAINALQAIIETDIQDLQDDVADLQDVTTVGTMTYAQLKTLKSAGKLHAGSSYRITDYTCVVDSDLAVSAGHAFDIVVTATGANSLSETAKAVPHAGDAYFADSRLDAWQLKYCFENDTVRFDWADENDGKGVIYFMRDEWGNEAPYDFKNIKFKRTKTGVGDYYAYTFSSLDNGTIDGVIAGTADLYDATVLNNSLNYKYVASANVIKENCTNATEDYFSLNNIVVIEDYGDGCYGNYFGPRCRNITAGRDFYNNKFDGDSYDLVFGDYCNDNAFGTNNYENTVGDSFQFNVFKSDCHGNVFGDNCSRNTLGSECNHNTVGDDCSYNTFGVSCANNTAGDDFCKNVFGNGCCENVFGKECENNTFGNYFFNNTVGNCCVSNCFGDGCVFSVFGNVSPSYNNDNFCYNTVKNGVRYVTFGDADGAVGLVTVEGGVAGAGQNAKLALFSSQIKEKSYPHTITKTADGKFVTKWLSAVGTESYIYKSASDSGWTSQ